MMPTRYTAGVQPVDVAIDTKLETENYQLTIGSYRKACKGKKIYLQGDKLQLHDANEIYCRCSTG